MGDCAKATPPPWVGCTDLAISLGGLPDAMEGHASQRHQTIAEIVDEVARRLELPISHWPGTSSEVFPKGRKTSRVQNAAPGRCALGQSITARSETEYQAALFAVQRVVSLAPRA